MSLPLLFETVRIQNGQPLHLSYHNRRMNSSRSKLLGCSDTLDLCDRIKVPQDLADGVFKCRVIYSKKIEKLEYIPYVPKRVCSLQVVSADAIEYSHKYLDRSALDALKAGVPADDIVIAKQGLITDSSAGNVVLFDGNRWITPAQPLLAGTTRARLLDAREIYCDEVRHRDLAKFKLIALINAMNDPNTVDPLPIASLKV